MNLIFIINQVIPFCLVDFQETTPPQKVKTYLLVDFILSKSEIQLVLLNPLRTFRNLL